MDLAGQRNIFAVGLIVLSICFARMNATWWQILVLVNRNDIYFVGIKLDLNWNTVALEKIVSFTKSSMKPAEYNAIIKWSNI